VRIILSVSLVFICFAVSAQTFSTTLVDSVTSSIDKDTSLSAKTITLDTLYSYYGAMIKTEDTFVVYLDPSSNQVYKIVWNNEGAFYTYVTIYYYKGFAIKGIVRAKYRRTDTNPEFETHSVFYYHNDKVVKEIEVNGHEYRANGFWYLSTVADMIKLAGLKLN